MRSECGSFTAITSRTPFDCCSPVKCIENCGGTSAAAEWAETAVSGNAVLIVSVVVRKKRRERAERRSPPVSRTRPRPDKSRFPTVQGKAGNSGKKVGPDRSDRIPAVHPSTTSRCSSIRSRYNAGISRDSSSCPGRRRQHTVFMLPRAKTRSPRRNTTSNVSDFTPIR